VKEEKMEVKVEDREKVKQTAQMLSEESYKFLDTYIGEVKYKKMIADGKEIPAIKETRKSSGFKGFVEEKNNPNEFVGVEKEFLFVERSSFRETEYDEDSGQYSGESENKLFRFIWAISPDHEVWGPYSSYQKKTMDKFLFMEGEMITQGYLPDWEDIQGIENVFALLLMQEGKIKSPSDLPEAPYHEVWLILERIKAISNSLEIAWLGEGGNIYSPNKTFNNAFSAMLKVLLK
jgi:hypothetical protein